MKKFLIIIMSVIMILSVIPISIFAEDADEEKKHWEIYDNYIYYKYDEKDDIHKAGGYIIDMVDIYLTDEFGKTHDELDISYFPEIADKISGITEILFIANHYIFEIQFKASYSYNDSEIIYTEQDIDDYIASLKYILSLPFVRKIDPGYVCSVEPIDPVDTTDTVSEDTETETATEVTETEKTEAVTSELVTSESVITETEVHENETTVKQEEENKLENPPTGDNLFLEVSVIFVVCTFAVTVVAVKGKKRSGER